MALFDDASLVVTPNGYKEGTLYSIKPTSGAGDMTVVRATTATRVNSAGLIELVPYNLLGYSQTFGNAYWTPEAGNTISSDSTTAPDGTLTADTFTATSGNEINVHNSTSLSLLGTFTYSIYLKNNGTNLIEAYLFKVGVGFAARGEINFSAGTFTASVGTGTIENVGNGWFRVSLTNTYTAGTFTTGTFTTSTTGTRSVYAWGAQLVEGTLPKDYLRTETRLNIPRLDYSNGTCPSILVEPQRTNLALYSSSFDNAAWTKENASVTANTTTSPDGTQNADSLIENSSSSDHLLYQGDTASAGSYTESVFMKKNTRQYGFLQIATDTAVNRYTIVVDLNNGNMTASSTSGVPTGTSYKIDSMGNGWYRLSVTATHTAGILYSVFGLSNSATPTFSALATPTYTGNGTGSIYVWGAQLEAGSYPTSYIPTTSAAVTRNADAIYKTGISSLIGQTEGVVFADFVCVNNSSYCDVVSIGTDGTTGVIEIQIDGAASNTLRATYYYGGFVANIPALATLTIGQRYKAAFAYKTNDFVFYLNGVQQGTDTSGTVVSGMSEVSLNGYGSSTNNKENALINSAVLFPTRLTNAELISLTTI
jgi:hypothetical protein